MRSNKDDRRVKYTKMVLKESLITLLTKKDISQITIKEICDGADVNRTTFYAHYSDQYDLLQKIEDELLDNMRAYLSPDTSGHSDTDTIDMVERIFEYIKENAELCRLLLSERGDINLQKRIMMLVYDCDIERLISNGIVTKDAARKEKADYIYAYMITGCVGAVQKWLEEDMRTPARTMAELLVKLTLNLITAQV